MSKPFVLNDETVENSYGFHVLTSGINTQRFESNPVMLSDHDNSNKSVLGLWTNLEKTGGKLLAVPEFDIEDPDTKKIAGKVERGYIKGASMGLLFKGENMIFLNGKVILKECELVEGTLIPVPSNPNSLRLYLKEGVPITDEELKKLCLSLQTENPEKVDPVPIELNQKNDMKKITLTLAVLAALSFDKATPEVDIEAVEAAVLSLSNANAELSAKVLAFQAKEENAATLAIETMVNLAVTEGRIPATKKEAFVALAVANFDLAKSTLEAIPAKVTLGVGIVPVVSGAVATKEDFQKLSSDAQLAFKTNSPDEYKKMFNVK
jgi:hypothetical protein